MAPEKKNEGDKESSTEQWLAYTVAQAQELRRSVADSTDTVLQSTRSYLSDLQSTSSHYSHFAQNWYHTVRSEYGHYEDIFFGKLKEGLQIASDHPAATCTVMAGAGLLLMKRPRRFLVRNTVGRFQSEESLLTRSENRVKELRQSIDLLKKESKKLEERAKLAEDELLRGRTKLKQVGTQIQKLVNSIHKTESQSQGLMESLRELPGRDALRFRAEVASMTAEAKLERNSLTKEVSKIANFGIPV
ncbi:hypothetical protein GOP47_0016209 [Adiantum capillus-veneris]|uniref:Uncharacterized protein n=1 Tax=Adiantum capillus-veneris TaxID=13818 RepID=A0A9D4UH88_ADICA|nr:hypothetical protein GOP47_0016209 [Adiantum capillus-veneris]